MKEPKLKTVYVCSNCGETSPRWMGRCPSCGSWNTMNEDVVAEAPKAGLSGGKAAAPVRQEGVTSLTARRLADISTTEEKSRILTGISELDRVLGGGIVLGGVVLLSGEPGVGKSTMLLQLCGAISNQHSVLYITGEESVRQVKLRAARLKVPQDNIFRLDVGFAFDGDADRCLCVDEKGNVITGDHILYIYGCYMKERGKLAGNKVVTTIMSNFGLYKAFDAAGIEYEKTAVGDKYVYENMEANGYRLGGEQSGHIIFRKYAATGDGILTAIKMMEVMLEKKMTLSKLAEPFTVYPQVLKNIRVRDKAAARNDEAVKNAIAIVEEKLGEEGRILVRESGTEPVLRIMVEADQIETCDAYVNTILHTIIDRGYQAE